MVAATSCQRSRLATFPFTLRLHVTNTSMAELCSMNLPRVPLSSGAALNYYITFAPRVRLSRFMAILFTPFIFETERQHQNFGRFKPPSSPNYDPSGISRLLLLLSYPTMTATVSAPFDAHSRMRGGSFRPMIVSPLLASATRWLAPVIYFLVSTRHACLRSTRLS